MARIVVVGKDVQTHETIRHVLENTSQIVGYPRGTLALDFVRDERPEVVFVDMAVSDVPPLEVIPRSQGAATRLRL